MTVLLESVMIWGRTHSEYLRDPRSSGLLNEVAASGRRTPSRARFESGRRGREQYTPGAASLVELVVSSLDVTFGQFKRADICVEAVARPATNTSPTLVVTHLISAPIILIDTGKSQW